MSNEAGSALQRSLDAIDRMRARILFGGWILVATTLGMYARLSYIHWTSDNLEKVIGASVAALTLLICWVAFAIILIVTRCTKSVLRAIELALRRPS